MVKVRFIVILFITLTIMPYEIFADDRDSVLFAPGTENCVWRAYSDGDIKILKCFKDSPYWVRWDIYHGTNTPLISPDKQYVAFIRQNNLWLYEPNTDSLIRITEVGMPQTKKYASIQVWTKEWSWDSRKILYCVSPGETEDVEGYEPVKKVRSAKYGFFIYDVKDKSRRIVAEFKYNSKKAPKDDLDSIEPNFHRIIIEKLSDGTTIIDGNKIDRELTEIDISPDGKWIVARINVPRESFNKDPRSQIVKIDLQNYTTTSLTQVGKWAEYQHPKFSPSGKHTFYIWRSGTEKGIPISNIIVDGKNIYTSPGLSHFDWINDNNIVFLSESYFDRKLEIIVIDSAMGKIKGRQLIEKGK